MGAESERGKYKNSVISLNLKRAVRHLPCAAMRGRKGA